MIRSVPYRSLGVSLGVGLLLLGASLAHAESSDTPSREQVETLQRTIERLNTRVESLEQQLSNRPASAPLADTGSQPASARPSDVPTGAPVQERWQRISHGLTLHDVEDILGRPQRTMTLTSKTVWYYSYPDLGSGSVVFAYNGEVIDWQTPPFRTWWW